MDTVPRQMTPGQAAELIASSYKQNKSFTRNKSGDLKSEIQQYLLKLSMCPRKTKM